MLRVVSIEATDSVCGFLVTIPSQARLDRLVSSAVRFGSHNRLVTKERISLFALFNAVNHLKIIGNVLGVLFLDYRKELKPLKGIQIRNEIL